MPDDTLTAIEGLRVGHATVPGVPCGCTVILPEGGAVAGVDIRGGAPGTYGTDTLNPINLVERIQGLFFTGGSAFGLSVADGVRQYLKERNQGFDTGYGVVPIVAGAVIFDMALNGSGRYPDAELGYAACLNASTHAVEEGNVGAGLGASVGKLYGMGQAMKGGLGSACISGSSGVRVAALVVVNAFGDVVDPALNRPIAGLRSSEDGHALMGTEREILGHRRLRSFPVPQNTTVGVVATNVKLNKTQLTKVAQMAHNGLARTIHPVHTLYDGDTLFALSCGSLEDIDVTVVGTMAVVATAEAVLRAVRKATSLEGLPACSTT